MSQLVAELLLSLHDRLELDEDASRHVEEVILSVQLLLLGPDAAAPLTQLIDRLLHLLSLELMQATACLASGWTAWLLLIVALDLKELVLQAIILFVGSTRLSLLLGELVLEPLDFLLGLLLGELGLLDVPLEALLQLEAALLVHGPFTVLLELKVHAQLHDLLILLQELFDGLLKLDGPITRLYLQIDHLRLNLVVSGLHLHCLSQVLLSQASVMVFKVLNKLILILQLLLDHLKLFFGQLERCVALRSHFQFDVILL